MAFMKFLVCIALAHIAVAVATPSSDSDWVFEDMEESSPDGHLPFLPLKTKLPSYTKLGVLNTFHPHMPMEIQVPSPLEIANRRPNPDTYFSGSAFKRTRTNRRDKDGNKINAGGTVIVSNQNGKVKKAKSGDAPNLEDEFVFPSIMVPDLPEFEPFDFGIDFEPMKPMKPLIIEPIKQINMKDYSPKEGETYIGTSSSSHVSSETINGKTKTKGGAQKMVNINGDVNEEEVAFGEQDKHKRKPKH